MDKLFICTNFQCSVYVYGASSDKCPECGLEGRPMTPKACEDFSIIYRETP